MRSLVLALVALPAVVTSVALAVPPEQYDPAAPTADLRLHLDSGTVQATPEGEIKSPATYLFTVTNEGPGAAPGTVLKFKASGDVHPVEWARPSQGTCQVNGRYADCALGELAPGATATVQIRSHPQTMEGSVGWATVASAKPDHDTSDNGQGKRPAPVPVTDAGGDDGGGTPDDGGKPPDVDRSPPDSNIGAPGSRVRRKSFRIFRGTASDEGEGVSAVEVAVLRVEARRCRWLSSTRATFAAGGCSTRKWLPARGSERWSYKLSRALPRGRYRVFTRATDASGNLEHGWSAGDRNVRSFTVR